MVKGMEKVGVAAHKFWAALDPTLPPTSLRLRRSDRTEFG